MTLPAASSQNGQYIFVDDTSQNRGTFWQTDNAVSLFTLDYTDYLATSETITEVSFTVTPTTTPPLTVTSATIVTASRQALSGVSALVGGGIVGQIYGVTANTTTSTEQVKVDTLAVQVTATGAIGCLSGYAIGGCCDCTGATGSTGGGDTGATGGTGGTGSANWLTSRAAVVDTPGLIVVARPGRQSVVLVNKGDVQVIVGPIIDMDFAANGLLIEAGDSLTLDSTTAVYGVAGDGFFEGHDPITIFVSETGTFDATEPVI